MRKNAYKYCILVFLFMTLFTHLNVFAGAYPQEGQLKGIPCLPEFTDTEFNSAKVRINIFGESWCKYCRDLEKEFPQILYASFQKEQVAVRIWDIEELEVKSYYNRCMKVWDLSSGARDSYPIIIINDSDFYCGYDASIRDSMLKDIKALLDSKPLPYGGNINPYFKTNSNKNDNNSFISNVFSNFFKRTSTESINSGGSIMRAAVFFLAGMVDGINPCALSMLLFFIMAMINTNREKTNILLLGVLFAAGTFIAYFLSGLGLISAIKQLYLIKYLPPILYGVAILFTFVFTILNFKDAYHAKRQNLKNIVLQLPQKNKKFVHDMIKKISKSNFKYPASFILGFCIILSELLCTGQIYLAAMIALNNVNGFMQKLYLFIFNIGFIIPVLIATCIIDKTKEITTSSEVLLNKLWVIKAITGIIMALLGSYIVYQFFLFLK